MGWFKAVNMIIATVMFLVAVVAHLSGENWQFSAFICIANLILATSHSA